MYTCQEYAVVYPVVDFVHALLLKMFHVKILVISVPADFLQK